MGGLRRCSSMCTFHSVWCTVKDKASVFLPTEGDLGACWEDGKMGGRAPACPWRTMTQRSSQDSACIPVSGRGSVQLCLPQPGQGRPVWCIKLQNATAQHSVVCAQMQGCPGPRTHVLEPPACMSSNRSPRVTRCHREPVPDGLWELYLLRRSPP